MLGNYTDTIPYVTSDADRAARFPAPPRNFRVQYPDGSMKKYNGFSWDTFGQIGESLSRLSSLFLVGDSVADDRNALDTLVNVTMQPDGGELDIVGVPRIGSNLSIPKNVRLIFRNGAYLAPDLGVTVTYNSSVGAGLYKIFGGGGNILFGSGAVPFIRVEWFGALHDGVTDDIAAFNKAKAAMPLVGGTIRLLPSVTYALSTAFTIDKNKFGLKGSLRSTVLLFTGATHGLVWSDAISLARTSVEGLEIQTSNAGALRGLNIDFHTSGGGEHIIRDIAVTVTGAGRWAFGMWGSNFETSGVYNVRIVQSATVGMHFEFFSNAIHLYNCEVTGSSGAGTITRALEVDQTTDFFWHGGTLQGWFTQSALYVTASGVHFDKTHFENTNVAPTDGADVAIGLVGGACINGSFSGCTGASFKIGGPAISIRAYNISFSECGAITFGSGAQGCSLIVVRAASITDTNVGANTVLGCSNAVGTPYANKFAGQAVKGITTVIPTALLNNLAAFLMANGASLAAMDSAGTLHELLFMSAGDQTFLQFLTALNIRTTDGTTRAQFSLSGVNTIFNLSGAAAQYRVNGTQVVGARGAAVADVASANASDLATAITLANETKTQVNAWLARARAHGLIA